MTEPSNDARYDALIFLLAEMILARQVVEPSIVSCDQNSTEIQSCDFFQEVENAATAG